MSTTALGLEEARATELVAAAEEEAAALTLGRACCEYDYRARRLSVRCGAKALGERSKRHVHSLKACLLRPETALLALASGSSDEIISERLRARWLGAASA